MYRRILVPLDGSQRAESILPYVEDLARRYGSSAVLLEVLTPIKTSILNPEVDTQIKEEEEQQEIEVRAYLNGRCAELRQKHIETHILTVRGHHIDHFQNCSRRERRISRDGESRSPGIELHPLRQCRNGRAALGGSPGAVNPRRELEIR